jgi:hypothetical protein
MPDRITTSVLRRLVNQPLTLRLYTGISPAGEYQEPIGGGYQALATSDWTIDNDFATGPVSEFRFDGSARLNILGAFITEADGSVIYAKAFKEPIAVNRRGDIIPVRPMLKTSVLT